MKEEGRKQGRRVRTIPPVKKGKKGKKSLGKKFLSQKLNGENSHCSSLCTERQCLREKVHIRWKNAQQSRLKET